MYERRADGEPTRSGISPTMIVLVVLAVIVVIFVLQNSDSQSVDFLMLDFKAPKWVIFALLILVGAALDRLLQFWLRRRKQRTTVAPPE